MKQCIVKPNNQQPRLSPAGLYTWSTSWTILDRDIMRSAVFVKLSTKPHPWYTENRAGQLITLTRLVKKYGQETLLSLWRCRKTQIEDRQTAIWPHIDLTTLLQTSDYLNHNHLSYICCASRITAGCELNFSPTLPNTSTEGEDTGSTPCCQCLQKRRARDP